MSRVGSRRRNRGHNGRCARRLFGWVAVNARLDDPIDARLDVVEAGDPAGAALAVRFQPTRRRRAHRARPDVFYALRSERSIGKPVGDIYEDRLRPADGSGQRRRAAGPFLLGKHATAHIDTQPGAGCASSDAATTQAGPQTEAAQICRRTRTRPRYRRRKAVQPILSPTRRRCSLLHRLSQRHRQRDDGVADRGNGLKRSGGWPAGSIGSEPFGLRLHVLDDRGFIRHNN